jgi:Arc/MetJ family transcription regulator
MAYGWCVSGTNIDSDDPACSAVTDLYGLQTKREAVNLVRRLAAVEPLDTGRALALDGSAWDGDLDEMRAGRIGWS